MDIQRTLQERIYHETNEVVLDTRPCTRKYAQRIDSKSEIELVCVCDPQTQVKYYGQFLRFFEIAETELFRAVGLPYAEVFDRLDLWLPRVRL